MTTPNTEPTPELTLNQAIGCYNESLAAIISFGELFDDTSLHDHDESDTCHLDALTDDDKSAVLARLMRRVETFVNLMPADQLPDDETVRLFHSKTAGTHRLEISRENTLPVHLSLQERQGVYETLLDLTASDMQEMNDAIFGDGVDPRSLPEEDAFQQFEDYRATHLADRVWLDFLINSSEMLNQALSSISMMLAVRDFVRDGGVPRG